MNPERAKQVLLLHRPGLDEPDAEVKTALGLLAQDAELRQWFEEQKATHAALRKEFRDLTPPAALKEQIISERPWHTRPAQARHLVAVAAAFVLVAALGFWWAQRPAREDKSFATYRAYMVRTAQRAYGMELETDRMDAIRTFFQERSLPADFVLPPGLARAESTGCLGVSWQTHRVAMICFKTGQPLPPGQSSDLWFFVIEDKGVPDAPKSTVPQFAKVNAVATATWTHDGKTYLLAVTGSEETLRKFL